MKVLRHKDIIKAYPFARASRRLLEACVLDTAFDVFLAETQQRGLFDACGMVFKGGTALRKFHLGHKSRLSFDLDFDIEEGTEALLIETMHGYSSYGFDFEFSERRGHHNLRVTSPHFPDRSVTVKLDFSNRGCWLEPVYLRPQPSPASPQDIWTEIPSIPTMRLHETVAEKLCRWQNRPLIRDLYDIAACRNDIDDLSLVAEMYVLKSHQNFSSQLPSRRPTHAARSLNAATMPITHHHMVFDDLVHPSLLSDADTKTIINNDLATMRLVAEGIDDIVSCSPLKEIANDNGKLAWRVDQMIEDLKSRNMSHSQPIDYLLASNPIDDSSKFLTRGQLSACGKIVKSTGRRCLLSVGHKGRCRSVL